MNSANCPLTLASPTSPTRRTITPYPLVRPSGDQHQDGSGRGPSAGAGVGGGARASTSGLPSASASGSRSGSQARTSGTAADSPTHTQASRQSFEPSPDLSRSSSARSARLSSSLLPALRLAGLVADPNRDLPRRDMRSTRSSRDASQKQRPLVILKLSASSFLDTVIRDDKTKDPLYILETTGENTAIYRLDHPRDEPTKAATVQWPVQPVRVKGKSGRSIQFGGGSWRESEELLKAGPLGNTAIRKFNIPHYPNSLKWKLIPGNCFCCVTNAVKGPVAVLDAATLSAPPRIKIYDTLIEKETARSQDNYKGIPTVLLDYLVVTALLLVTDVQEWLDRPRTARIPGSNSYTIQRWLALIHNRPAPPEPEHPTVDLSLTVPSTPPHSATIPSPGGFWETQSGVTSFSGSNGSGSGASYLGEPFTPTTPATPATPATSAHSSAFFSRSTEDAPPVPPVPGSSSASSPFAFNVESSQARERPKSHSPSSSTSTAQVPGTATQSHEPQTEEEEPTPHPRARPPQPLSLLADAHLMHSSYSMSAATSPSTSTPSSGLPVMSPISTTSSRTARRQLPTPPGPAPVHSYAQPWLYSSTSASTPPVPASVVLASLSSSASNPASPASTSSSTSASARAARASIRGSLRTAPIPPPPPPPQHQIPLPPKLAQEQQGYASRNGQRPRTAPEFDMGNRRRHSAGEFGEYSGQAGPSSNVHPYAAAAQSYRERDGLESRMQNLRLSTVSGPSNVGGHIRAPSQPAPDYDAHSFVNMSPPAPPVPPLPTPPGSSNTSGVRSPPPGRRVLTVVNADATTMPVEDPGLCVPSEREARGRPRMSTYAESVYEAPPPAYDAIDFSVPPMPSAVRSGQRLPAVPQAQPLPTVHQAQPLPAIPPVTPLPPIPQVQPLPPISHFQPMTPLPVPPVEAREEGQHVA